MYVSWEDYPFEKFPHHPAGMTTFYSRAAVREFYTAAPYVKHLNVDDAYVGIIAAKLGLELTDLKPFVRDNLDVDRRRKALDVNVMRSLISWHTPFWSTSTRIEMWNQAHGK